MKRNAWIVAAGLMGLAACSHHNDAKTAQAGDRPSAAQQTTTTTPRNEPSYTDNDARSNPDIMSSGVTAPPAQAVRGETSNVKSMRTAVAALMNNDTVTQAEMTAALNAIAAALVDVPNANTGDGADRMRANIGAIQKSGINDERTPLRVHASLVQALEAMRTVNDPVKADVVEMAVSDLRRVDSNKPIAQQTSSVREAICSVGNAVAIAYDTRELSCGGATASAK